MGTRTDVLHWPGMRSEYSWIPPGEGATRTEPNQVGVSFSQHRAAVYESADRTVEHDITAGSVFVTGRDPITWTRTRETAEALEIYPDLGLLASVSPDASGGAGASAMPEIEPAATRDGVVLAIASILKRAHTAGAALSDVAASTLAHRLAGHLLEQYAGVATPPAPGRLDRRTVDRVAEFVDAGLSGTLTLDRLAAVATLSPFHFARAFKASTGLAPHQFVTARRMQRATTLLVESPASVVQVAHAVGMSNVSHFRRVFRAHTGVLPGELREESKSEPSARRDGMRWSSPAPG
jgi:AraC-like DNA-binding protein